MDASSAEKKQGFLVRAKNVGQWKKAIRSAAFLYFFCFLFFLVLSGIFAVLGIFPMSVDSLKMFLALTLITACLDILHEVFGTQGKSAETNIPT